MKKSLSDGGDLAGADGDCERAEAVCAGDLRLHAGFGLGFGIWVLGLGFGVWGLGFRFTGSAARPGCSPSSGMALRGQGLGVEVGVGACGLGVGVWGLGFGV